MGNYGYTGLRYDSLTTYWVAVNRWYDPATDQWLEVDPDGYAGGLSDLRDYVGNDWTNRTDLSGLAERRVWVISTQDKATVATTFWHSFTGTVNSLQPFGASDATIRPDPWTLPEVVKQMEEPGLLSDDTSITFFEISGHGGKVQSLIPLEYLDSSKEGYDSPEGVATRDAIAKIVSKLAPDAEIKLAGWLRRWSK